MFEELSDEELPTLYQFDLHYKQKSRACGFYIKGFSIWWFDKDHLIILVHVITANYWLKATLQYIN
jgi:hypothetical protein